MTDQIARPDATPDGAPHFFVPPQHGEVPIGEDDPTLVLALAQDDQHRIEIMGGLAARGTVRMDNTHTPDISRHFTDPANAPKAIDMGHYAQAGPAEKAATWLFSRAVRRAVRNGTFRYPTLGE